MRGRACSAILIAALAAAVSAASLALAAQPLRGRTYAGLTAHGKLPVILAVSRSGQITVTVPSLPLYCEGGGGPVQAVTKPDKVRSDGSFSGTIVYRSKGKNAYKGTFSGRFATSRLIRGTIRSEYSARNCSGTTTFTAKPR